MGCRLANRVKFNFFNFVFARSPQVALPTSILHSLSALPSLPPLWCYQPASLYIHGLIHGLGNGKHSTPSPLLPSPAGASVPGSLPSPRICLYGRIVCAEVRRSSPPRPFLSPQLLRIMSSLAFCKGNQCTFKKDIMNNGLFKGTLGTNRFWHN